MDLFWHRSDLRATDNAGLATAVDGESVLPVYLIDDRLLDYAGAPRVAFMLDALRSLREWYRDRGSELVVARADPREAIPEIATRYGAERVVWNEAYSGTGRDRDAAVRRALEGRDISRESVHDDIHHEPGSITTNQGEPYSVYTYFWRKWRDRPKADPHEGPGRSSLVDAQSVEGDDVQSIPSIGELGVDPPEADIEPASPEQALDRLEAFCAGPIYRYEEDRDYPAKGCTSRLSAHLAWGTIGPRRVYAATEAALDDAESEAERDSVEEFQAQLAWREFYTHVLYFNPEVVTENYKDYEHPIEWREDPEALQAWKDGETGYPIVDAGMRQLRAEAYMHNRVRMIVASFLTKDLLLDWREGYAWFRERLTDHNTANDNGGWQWAASTGTDAQPYFRIFNPMTQGERYDPEAEYIKTYVPELEGVPADAVHDWHELDPGTRRMHAAGYPDPIVAHSQRREEALAMFEAARGEDD